MPATPHYTNAAKNAMLDELGTLITHVGLQDTSGAELSGGSPAYARKAISWNAAASGNLDSSNQPVFDVPASTTVRFVTFHSAGAGGTLYAKKQLAADEVFGAQGTLTVDDADLNLNNDPVDSP